MIYETNERITSLTIPLMIHQLSLSPNPSNTIATNCFASYWHAFAIAPCSPIVLFHRQDRNLLCLQITIALPSVCEILVSERTVD